MYTDLFLALKDDQNPRGHPILAALLYVFCPAAARWWLAGADPEEPFDPTWRSLSDLASGEQTLKEALERYGFEGLIEQARKYVEQVESYRRLNSRCVAPELTPMFPGGRLDVTERHLHNKAIKNLGGAWPHFFSYIRTWAFCVDDWEECFRFSADAEAEFSRVRVAMTLPGVRRPAYFQTWQWVARHGHTRRYILGMIAASSLHDQLRFTLVRRANPEGNRPWPVQPEVWALQINGQASPSEASFSDAELPSLVERLAGLAKDGPHPPVTALQEPSRCRLCGYRAQCYDQRSTRDELTSLALEFCQ